MNSLLAIFKFELKRIMTPGRFVWWVLVAAFPVAITLLMSTFLNFQVTERSSELLRIERELHVLQSELFRKQQAGEEFSQEDANRLQALAEEYTLQLQSDSGGNSSGRRFQGPPVTQENVNTIYTFAIYFLAPSIACMLGALLTGAPSVASELEQHSWIYLATRPNGLFHLIMGKYLVAVLWSASATIVGISLSLPVSQIDGMAKPAMALIALAVLSAGSYSALYVMIGTVFPKRAMVFCVAYTAGVELFMGFFPAVINRLTIQYRLRSLLLQWTEQSEEFKESELISYVASTESVLIQLVWLASFTAVFLAVALTTVQVREFTTAVESDV